MNTTVLYFFALTETVSFSKYSLETFKFGDVIGESGVQFARFLQETLCDRMPLGDQFILLFDDSIWVNYEEAP